jgi:hypothetical protein
MFFCPRREQAEVDPAPEIQLEEVERALQEIKEEIEARAAAGESWEHHLVEKRRLEQRRTYLRRKARNTVVEQTNEAASTHIMLATKYMYWAIWEVTAAGAQLAWQRVTLQEQRADGEE